MLVDKALALEELGITEEDYQEFLGDLLVYVAEVLPQFQPIVAGQGERTDLHHLAHALKGACRNMRFVAAGDLAFELEQWGACKTEIDPAPVYARLVQVLEASFAEFGMQLNLA